MKDVKAQANKSNAAKMKAMGAPMLKKASGGRAKKASTKVNVIVAPGKDSAAPMPAPQGMPPAPPMPRPAPPMAGLGGMGGAPMMPRKRGGAAKRK